MSKPTPTTPNTYGKYVTMVERLPAIVIHFHRQCYYAISCYIVKFEKSGTKYALIAADIKAAITIQRSLEESSATDRVEMSC